MNSLSKKTETKTKESSIWRKTLPFRLARVISAEFRTNCKPYIIFVSYLNIPYLNTEIKNVILGIKLRAMNDKYHVFTNVLRNIVLVKLQMLKLCLKDWHDVSFIIIFSICIISMCAFLLITSPVKETL